MKRTIKMKSYIALFEFVPSEEGFGVVFPDLPGLTSAGDTYEEAVQNATEALANHIDLIKEHGWKVPLPRTFEKIRENWEDWKNWEKNYNFYIEHIKILPPYGNRKILVSIDSGLIARIDRVSKNRSAFFASAAEKFLDEYHV